MSIKQGEGIQGSKQTSNGSNQNIEELLKQNLEITRDLQERVQKIHNFIKWQRIFGVLKVLIIVVPLILSIIYLPAILKNVITPYQELLGGTQDFNSAGGGFNINSLLNGL